ncbi:SRPBCC family protein [Homoserinibacter sp. GY 40078]|uniref:SRPBCC family protein n=1 Tax=Homoserinibacter sp. GY 40078 TaxID=2603275 RepID=UPI0011C7AC16|nr:SRPBCC family protein [Homoserinibacter sp. GY 40078]TXK19554.1 SRPBCC family protein [Homoserinibacter sp. GY 40078]
MALISDPLGIAGLVSRELRAGERDGVPTRIVVARREYATDIADLWNALTDPERIPRWFLPISGELTPGGRYALTGNASGTIESCDAPHRFSLTWEAMGQVSWVAVTLEPAERGTVMQLEHEASVDPGFWSTFGPGAVGIGWDGALMGLGLYLESGTSADPSDVAAFPFTDEGRVFHRAASDGWTEAAISGGEDPEAMREAGDRAYAFYTTLPEGTDAPE